MNCKRHPSSPAVAQCKECGSYLCASCASLTQSAKETFGTLCVDCYKAELRDVTAYYQDKKNKSKTSLIASIVFFIIGAIALLVGVIMTQATGSGNDETVFYGFVAAIGGYALMGLFPVIQEWRSAASDHEEYERRHGVTYHVTDTGDIKRDAGWGTILPRVAVKLLFGPLSSIIMWFGFASINRECDEYIESFTAELAALDKK